MYLHLGQETLVNTSEVVGLFDLDTTTIAKSTREGLAAAEKAGQVVNVSTELPKSFVVVSPVRRRAAQPKARQVLYISQLSAPTLKKRLGRGETL
ncbi:DUF370 domain-containing protein [Ruminococcaceae bacterium OttesenSCG-928-O06]|nr:DUF370 domain-containing protein [Ruminococcaceae bacterium OttesenSCG-928-O06]